MEETKKTNKPTEKHLSENDTEDAKAFKIEGPKCLMEEDFRKIVDYDRFSWENARNLDERVQKKRQGDRPHGNYQQDCYEIS